jgi:ligand-binding SRPBCC domain-containing protein
MAFEFIYGGDEPMYPGQIITYKVAILPGVRVRWLTQITYMEPGHRFIDEQRIGPYRLWIHEHRFDLLPNGVRMTDHVTYALPFGLLGNLIHTIYIRRRLEKIFDYRYEKVLTLFASTPKALVSVI